MSYDFKARFNEEDFMGFVKNKMFPGSDFYWKRANYNTKDFALNRIKSITLLGRSEDFDLAIYDMTHESENDPKVSLTREAFKFMRQNVEASTLNALIIFRSNNSDNYRLSLLTTDYNNVGRKTEREISNPRRFSFYLGPDAKTKTPEQFLIKKGAISNLEDLKSRFSVEVVNKEFYSNIAGLFYRFIDEAKYPNADRKKFFAVKLIGRIIFCWFLKKKKSDAGKPLMPEELLSLESLGKHQNYFHSVLEPLFFEVLNTPVEKRTSTALLQIEDFAKSIPFLNGGLFEPDDDDKYQGTASYGVIEIDDSWFNDLFELLETYNFTINENTPVDVELSIDPEMLGRIFENLLAEINPETGESARKATGSFYTPREIVEYMVNESLKAYLLQKVEIDEETVDKLLNWSEEAPELSESQSNGILEALDKMKVLDPACGSGAFPMGILQKTALVLEKIDPQSKKWITKMVEKIPDSNLRKFVEDQLHKEDLSYVHKLGIIQKSIYGVDIQPIAVEISKLRFFLSLIIDSKIDDKEKNRGVKPLPNLETKFVCANTLIGLEKSDLEEEAKIMLPTIADTEKELFRTRNSYFTAHTKEEKIKIQKNDEKLRTKLLSILVENGFKEDVTKNALMLAAWNPYKHNEVAPFFDPEWMFGVQYGFDIVIGNPPYIQLQKEGGKLAMQYANQGFDSFTKTGDIYALFYERGNKVLKNNGHLCFITSNKWMRAGYGEKLRNYFASNTNPLLLVDFAGVKIFDSATVDTNILLFQKGKNQERTLSCIATALTKDGLSNLSDFVQHNSSMCNFTTKDSWVILSPIEQSIKQKIEAVGIPLKDWDISINYGIKTGFNDAFIISGEKRDEILANCKTDEERHKTAELIRPILRGRDIKRYSYNWANLWLIYIPWHFPLQSDQTIQGASEKAEKEFNKQYPAVYSHLLKYKKELSARNKAETGIRYEWYAMQRWGANYWEEFNKPKIIYPNMTKFLPFYYDEKQFLTNQKCFIITGKSTAFLTAFFNSSLFKYCFRDSFPELLGGTRELSKIFFDKIPVIQIDETTEEKFRIAVNDIQNEYQKAKAIEIDSMIFDLYDLSTEERKVIDFIEIL